MSRIKETFAVKMSLIRNQQSFRDLSDDIMQKTGVSISHSTLHDYENASNNIMPKFKNLEALAEYAGVKPSWFWEEMSIEYQNPDELLKEDGIAKTVAESNPKYITDEFALEVAKLIARDGTLLNQAEKSFLLNMVKTYIASVANEK